MAEKGSFPLGGAEGPAGRATATCYCGAIRLEFPSEGEDLVDTFICHCTDCRKLTSSMFASNFIVNDSAIKYIKGEDKITRFTQSATIETGNDMTNEFCSICGTLMNRVSSGYPGKSILRIGTIDDFNLQETKLKPRIVQYSKNKVAWVDIDDKIESHQGGYYVNPVKKA